MKLVLSFLVVALSADMGMSMDNETCIALGEKTYRFIMNKCYFFDKVKRSYGGSLKNCETIFGEGTKGKLVEPLSKNRFKKISAAAHEIIGTSKGIHSGFMKLDDAGKHIIFNSTGLEMKNEFWSANPNQWAHIFINDVDEPYLRFYIWKQYDHWETVTYEYTWLDGLDEYGKEGKNGTVINHNFMNRAICESYE